MTQEQLAESSERCGMAIEILQITRDGRELFQTEENIQRYGRNGDGWQLALIQHAVNGFLDARGMELFRALHDQVKAGDYRYALDDFVARFLPEWKKEVPR